ncbi:PAS domain-containing protein [Streptomyces sp. NPDC101234]|uniref:PP2C family protein-serine/threonine phosphatase n=1 Tax=Streptomyces sp. NPDC101234 TaxID=3366138 RepID=UPI003813776E
MADTAIAQRGPRRPVRSVPAVTGPAGVAVPRCLGGAVVSAVRRVLGEGPSGHRHLCGPAAWGPGPRCGLCGKDGGAVEGLRSGGEHERRLSAVAPGLWQQVVEQLGTAVAVIDPAGRIVAVNPAAERLLGRPAAVVNGQDLHDLCRRDPGGAPLPEHGRIQLAARYQPAPAGSQVGGDWYDAFTLRDATLALVIGDVVGRDLTAAVGMAQLHGILRSLAWDHTGPTGCDRGPPR